MTIGDALLFLIQNGPGRTETELAAAIFGSDGYQQRVNGDCTLMANRGQIERRGAGGASDPYRYYLSDKAAFYAKDDTYGAF